MSPIDPQQYPALAAQFVVAVGNIKKSIQENGLGTVTLLGMLAELMKITTVGTDFITLSASERKKFIAEVWDQSIGTEPHALVNKVGVFQGETLETLSDAMKLAAVAYIDSQLPTTT